MYYITYRPRTLTELDNESVRTQLTNILTAPKLPHAFLFTGPKGTGKTSTARIVATILNCAANAAGHLATLEPSQDDENVRAITQGTSPDVIEIDAASNRKIDDIRQIIAELKFAPLVSRYKMYIIDEVHMLTKEAFNALLKSLEEPPASTIFVLATTEADALPRTIVSRCIPVHFGMANQRDIRHMFDRITSAENISLSDDVLEFIAQHADGSFRDAAKLLEIAVTQKVSTVEDMQRLLGHVWNMDDLLSVIESGSLQKALAWIDAAAHNGANFRILTEELLRSLHNALMQKNGIDVDSLTKYNLSTKEIALLMSLFQRAYGELKYSPVQSLPLELAVVEYFQKQDSL